MIKPLSFAAAALAMSTTVLLPTQAADAQRYRGAYAQAYDDGYNQDYRGYREYRGRDRSYAAYRARQKCNDGDGGTIVGAIAGGLLGRSVAGRGDHVLATVIGAGAGALAGRAIDRSDRPDYCRR